MAKNQKHTTIASINYLNEISAFPAEIRSGYLSKLLRRENSESQKNVRLLRIIYGYVEQDKISKWDSAQISRTLGITEATLYKHKSRLLKGLRELFFNWKEVEKEIEEKFDKEKDSIELMLEKARKMKELGMLREAKITYVILEKELRQISFENPAGKYLLLSEIYEYMTFYYYYRKKKKKILHYTSRLNDIFKVVKALNLNLSEKDEALFSIRIYFGRLNCSMLEWYKKVKNIGISTLMKKTYMLCKISTNYSYLLNIIYKKAGLETTLGKFDKAIKLCLEGKSLAKRLKQKTAYYSFASLLHFINIRINPANVKLYDKNILVYYHQIKKTMPLNPWTLYLENSIILPYYPEKRKEILAVYREQINSNILRGDFSVAVYWKFVLSLQIYNNNIFSFLKHCSYGYLELSKIDENILDNIERTCVNTLCYQKQLNDEAFIWDVYMLQPWLCFSAKTNLIMTVLFSLLIK
ncbi:MAG: hypothetical protein L0Y79_01205 [Chlorobi bacterium]|nr:hypothetical protein [Chlorobiota bacterium]